LRPADLAAIRAEALRTLAAVDPRGLWLTIADQRNGYPSGGFDAVAGSSETSSTEAAALSPDRAAEALRQLEHDMGLLRRAVDNIGHLHTMWTAPPRRAICSNCADPTGSFTKDLCRWCATWLADTHTLPTLEQIVARQSGLVRNARRPKNQAA
jgi:hypothetical protein